MAKAEPKLFRVGQAALELGLHPMTVRRWIKAGRIQIIQVGREMRIPRSEIERLVGQPDDRLLVLYGRVSGHGQADDLAIQMQRLQIWAATERRGVPLLALSDIGSGLKATRSASSSDSSSWSAKTASLRWPSPMKIDSPASGRNIRHRSLPDRVAPSRVKPGIVTPGSVTMICCPSSFSVALWNALT